MLEITSIREMSYHKGLQCQTKDWTLPPPSCHPHVQPSTNTRWGGTWRRKGTPFCWSCCMPAEQGQRHPQPRESGLGREKLEHTNRPTPPSGPSEWWMQLSSRNAVLWRSGGSWLLLDHPQQQRGCFSLRYQPRHCSA